MGRRVPDEKGEAPPSFRGELPGLGPARKARLLSEGIGGVEDLLFWMPIRYEDRRHPTPIRELQADQTALIRGKLLDLKSRRARRRGMSVTEALVSDGTGNLHVIWFNAPWIERSFPKGAELFLFGRVTLFSTRAGLRLQMDHPEAEPLPAEGEGTKVSNRIVPIYRRVGEVNSRLLRGWISAALEGGWAKESLPAQLLSEEGYPDLASCFQTLHLPEEVPDFFAGPARRARGRLAFEEFLGMQCVLSGVREARGGQQGVEIPKTSEAGELLRRILPFHLTGAQRTAFREIAGDLASPNPMYRLLQGDVGSGKTVVAFLSMVWAAHAGFQAAFMAPTEILARQQARVLSKIVEKEGLEVGVLTASTKAKERRELLQRLASGELKLVVGTHSLFQDEVLFQRLGLVVIDEQHRFGVAQRARLVAKGENPNVLVMTATPIPRSLALTLFGDLDLSVLDERPPGRKPVVTKVRGEEERPRVESFLRKEMDKGCQVFVVYPLVEESEETDAKAASEAYLRLTQGPFRGYPAALLHGRMKGAEKEAVMESVRSGSVRLLVATTVVEVGVDLPEASVMVVEHADRFGLAQLHQLRGRVGRGTTGGWCILMRSPDSGGDVVERLSVLERTEDGFEIAEADLRLRGPGDPGGLRQWGGGGLRVANPIRDREELEKARRWAQRLVEGEIRWESGERERFETWRRGWEEKMGSWGRIG